MAGALRRTGTCRAHRRRRARRGGAAVHGHVRGDCAESRWGGKFASCDRRGGSGTSCWSCNCSSGFARRWRQPPSPPSRARRRCPPASTRGHGTGAMRRTWPPRTLRTRATPRPAMSGAPSRGTRQGRRNRRRTIPTVRGATARVRHAVRRCSPGTGRRCWSRPSCVRPASVPRPIPPLRQPRAAGRSRRPPLRPCAPERRLSGG